MGVGESDHNQLLVNFCRCGKWRGVGESEEGERREERGEGREVRGEGEGREERRKGRREGEKGRGEGTGRGKRGITGLRRISARPLNFQRFGSHTLTT